jgi:hypothetical protein
MNTDDAFVNALQDRLPIRIFTSLSKREFNSADYLYSVERFVQSETRKSLTTTIPKAQPPPLFKILAV